MDRKHTLLLLLAGLTGPAMMAQNFAELDINDVRARFHSTGLIGPDLSSGTSAFIVPASGLSSPLYSGGLWMGGYSTDNQLKFAAHLYGAQGERDFFPGPLTVDGTAAIGAGVSNQYDRVWTVLRSDVLQHRAYFDCVADPGCDEATAFPGYTTPSAFLDWPAMGDVEAGQATYLAPFFDRDGDGVYEPSAGDHPCVLGDQALYTIFNDKLDLHTQSGGQPIGMEIHMMPFAYSGDPALAQTIFIQYKLINRSAQTLTGFRVGHFTDSDLGCSDDDVVGTDVGRNLVYVANGDADDVTCAGGPGYGTQPPAFGMVVLKGPLLDADGTDNTTEPAIAAFNGSGFDDDIPDNERYGLDNSMYFQRSSPEPATTDPAQPAHYYNQLSSIWKDGLPFSHGGTGYSTDPGAVPSRFAFPGTTDPAGLGTGGVPQGAWSNDLDPARVDPKLIVGMGSSTLEPGEHIDILVAYVYARAAAGGPQGSVAALQARVDSIRSFASAITGAFTIGEPIPTECTNTITLGMSALVPQEDVLHVHPVPATTAITITRSQADAGAVLLIFDAQGALVAQQRSAGPSTLVDVSTLPQGLYTVRVLGDRSEGRARFVKE